MTEITKNVKHAMRLQRRVIRKRLQYAVMRNVIPLNRAERQITDSSVRVMANSIPKAGTNLLSRLMRLMPGTVDRWTYHVDESLSGLERQIQCGRAGQVITAHLPWTQALADQFNRMDYRTFLMVRDPRDVMVSGVHYVTRMDKGHPLHRHLNNLPDDDARLLAMINPPPADLNIPEVWKNDNFRTFLPWFDEPACMVIRFEDLVGVRGGGSDAAQQKCIRDVAQHMRVDLSDEQLHSITNALFGNKSRTFRKGQIGDWPNQFNDAHKAAYKEQAGDVLIKMGYETGLDW